MAENPFNAVGSQLVSGIFGSILWFGIAVIIIGVVVALVWYFIIYKRKFDIKVRIYSDRAGDRSNIIYDKAAILYDRQSKSKFFRIWGSKIELPVPPFNVLQATNQGDLLEIRRLSDEDFMFLAPATINKTEMIKEDGKLYTIGKQDVKQISTQTAFWSQKRKGMNKKMFDNDSLLLKLLPYLPHIITGVLLIFLAYIMMDKLPPILQNMKELTDALHVLQQGNVIS